SPDGYANLVEGWDYAQVFASELVAPLELGRLTALLRREGARAQPSSVVLPMTLDIATDFFAALKKIPVNGWVSLTHAQRRELILGRRSSNRPPTAEGHQESPADDSAYCPAKLFLDSSRFTTYKRLHAALRAHPWIRTRKPSQQRLTIHAGD